MKKILVFLVLLLSLTLVGCSTTTDTSKEEEFTADDLVGTWYVQTNENPVNEPQEASITWIFKKDGSFTQTSETDIEGIQATTSELVGTYEADEDTITCQVKEMTVDAMTITGDDIPENEREVKYEYSIKVGPSGEDELTVKNLDTGLEGIYFKES